MSGQTNGSGWGGGPSEPLIVVRVQDVIEPVLTGRQAGAYESPAQPRAQAIALVSLLVGHAANEQDDQQRWVVPIAGGRRIVPLTGESAK